MLLCGEYYITEDEAAAICLGIEPRATLCVCVRSKQSPASLRIVECYANTRTVLSADESRFWALAQKLAPNVYHRFSPRACLSYVPFEFSQQFRKGSLNHSVEICIDSSAQYDIKTGEKRGLGSSASCAVLVSAAHMLLSGIDPLQDRDVLETLACKVHYQWQGMKGSGYDVCASVYGDCLYLKRKNGQEGGFSKKKIDFPTHLRWVHWNNGKSVSSRDALKRYQAWKKKNPELHKNHYNKLQVIIQQYFLCSQEYEYYDWLNALNGLGEKLGDYIGQSAVIEAEDSVTAWKASGAGNEQAIGIVEEEESDSEHAPRHERSSRSSRSSRTLHEICVSEGLRMEEGSPCRRK